MPFPIPPLNWHNIGTVLLFSRKSLSAIMGTVKILRRGRLICGRSFCCKGGEHHITQKNPKDPGQ